jgi:LPS sulfotransferase NodH
MKNFYFLCALPRSGATLLSSIINQSNQIKVSPNSVIWDILSFLIKMKTT